MSLVDKPEDSNDKVLKTLMDKFEHIDDKLTILNDLSRELKEGTSKMLEKVSVIKEESCQLTKKMLKFEETMYKPIKFARLKRLHSCHSCGKFFYCDEYESEDIDPKIFKRFKEDNDRCGCYTSEEYRYCSLNCVRKYYMNKLSKRLDEVEKQKEEENKDVLKKLENRATLNCMLGGIEEECM